MKLPCGCRIEYEFEDGQMVNYIRPHDKECQTFKFMMEQSEVKRDTMKDKVTCKRLITPHYQDSHAEFGVADCVNPRKAV